MKKYKVWVVLSKYKEDDKEDWEPFVMGTTKQEAMDEAYRNAPDSWNAFRWKVVEYVPKRSKK